MNITAYTNNSPPNKINKSLTQIATYTGTLRGPCSLISPSITLQTATFNPLVNYIYITEYARYYYINDYTIEVNGLYTINCSVDATESFKNQILALTGVIERQEKIYDLYLNDPIFRADQQTHTQFIEFTNGFETTPTILLTTI